MAATVDSNAQLASVPSPTVVYVRWGGRVDDPTARLLAHTQVPSVSGFR